MTDQEEEEAGICQTCHGKGRYQRYKTKTVDGVDYDTVEIVDCNACDGMGYEKEDGDVN